MPVTSYKVENVPECLKLSAEEISEPLSEGQATDSVPKAHTKAVLASHKHSNYSFNFGILSKFWP